MNDLIENYILTCANYSCCYVLTSVIDMDGVGFRTAFDPERRNFILRFISVMSENYPQRSFRTLIINTPKWFGGLYRLAKPLLRESTRKKIEILIRGPNQDKVLRKYLGAALPPTLLFSGSGDKESQSTGSSHQVGDMSVPKSALEHQLREFVSFHVE